MHRIRSAIAAALAAGVLASAGMAMPPTGLAAATAPSKAVPRVVLIVGPAGSSTERYRAAARAAAAVARRTTPDVTELYSPNATWPAVKAALQGASLVVYMGHGNGWPSRYRDALYPPSQDGFGLDPLRGADGVTHQYAGEDRIGAQVRLAPNAVVLLHHLCYASGLSEPGLPEGTVEVARQRVDNYAAGFIRAGAAAVIAEAYTGPAGYVAAILGGNRSIDALWRASPTANGHAVAFDSTRSPGYIAEMDPKRTTSGFERSIVLKAGLVSADVRAGARGSAAGRLPLPADPTLSSLIQTGIVLEAPTLTRTTMAGARAQLRLPFRIGDRRRLPSTIGVSLRWDPIDIERRPSGDPAPTPIPSAPFDLVTPESPGSVLEPVPLKIGRSAMTVDVPLPHVPGRYRLTITLHDDQELPFDAISQAMLPTLLVRITGEVDGAIVAPTAMTLMTGSHGQLPVGVVNLGTAAWGRPAIPGIPRRFPETPGTSARLLGHWVALTPGPADAAPAPPPADVDAALPVALAPKASADLMLDMDAPTTTGDYLLVLDVVVPGHGSLAAAGLPPTIVRVSVVAPVLGPNADLSPAAP